MSAASPTTTAMRSSLPRTSRASARPSAMEMPVPAWPPSNTSCGLSVRRGKPPMPPSWRSVPNPRAGRSAACGRTPGGRCPTRCGRWGCPAADGAPPQLDHAQGAAQVAAGVGDGADDRLADLLAQLSSCSRRAPAGPRAAPGRMANAAPVLRRCRARMVTDAPDGRDATRPAGFASCLVVRAKVEHREAPAGALDQSLDPQLGAASAGGRSAHAARHPARTARCRPRAAARPSRAAPRPTAARRAPGRRASRRCRMRLAGSRRGWRRCLGRRRLAHGPESRTPSTRASTAPRARRTSSRIGRPRGTRRRGRCAPDASRTMA